MQVEREEETPSTPNAIVRNTSSSVNVTGTDRVLELRKSLREEQTKREKAETEKTQWERKFKDKQKKSSQLKAEKATLEEQIREHLKNIERLENEKKAFEQKKEKKKNKINGLEVENQNLNKQVKLYKKTIEQLEGEKGNLEKKMKRSSVRLSEELEKLEEHKSELEREHTKKLEELTNNADKLHQNYRQNVHRRSVQLDAKSVEEALKLETLEDQKKELEKKNREIQKKVEDLELENNNLKSQYKISTDKLNQKILKLEDKVESLNERIKTLQSQNQEIVVQAQKEKEKPVIKDKESNEQFVIKLYNNEPPPSVERKTTTTGNTIDQRFDENLVKQSGAERAKIWSYEYQHGDNRWDEGKWSSQCIVIKLEKRPFAEGSLRTAYYARNLSTPDILFVAKLSKNRSHGRAIYENDVEMQVFCRKWAEKFNEEKPPKKVSFVDIWLLEFLDRPHQPVATLEIHLEGEYKKYSNNDGQVSGGRNTPQAFSHWTYERSNHEFVIVDIQGVGDNYTDPQVHTKDHKGHGMGNLGQKGIVKFLITHECNAVCKYLKLSNTQDRYGKLPSSNYSGTSLSSIGAAKFDKGTMPFPFALVENLDFSQGIQVLDENSKPSSTDFTSFKCLETIKGEKFTALCLKGKLLFAGSTNNIIVYDLEKSAFSGVNNNGHLEIVNTLKGHLDIIEALCCNDTYVFSASADKDIRVWSTESYKCVQTLTEHTSSIKALLLDKDNKYLYSAGNDKIIRIWSLSDFTCVHLLVGHEKFVKALAISSDSKVLFSGGNDNIIKVWDLVSGKKPECVFNFDSHTKWLKSLSVNGRYLFSGANDKRFKVWDLKTMELIKTLKPHTDKVNVVLSTSEFLLTSSDDATMKLFDYKTLECVATLGEHKGMVVAVCMNESERLLCSAAFDGIKVHSFDHVT